jgi:hypothetical protein
MADDRKSRASWLERRRDAKRVKKEKRAQAIAEKRQHEGAAAEHATHKWAGGGPGG